MVGRNHPKWLGLWDGVRTQNRWLSGLGHGLLCRRLGGSLPQSWSSECCVRKAAEIWGNQQVGSNEYMIQLYNYIQLHMVLFLWEYLLNNMLFVFFLQVKPQFPFFLGVPEGELWMTGWFVDLNWDVR